MASLELQGFGSTIELFRMFGTDNIAPERFTITTATSIAAKSATSITISATTNTQTYKATATRPIYLTFTDATGIETLATITDDIAPGATSLTCLALPKQIEIGATSNIPVLFRGRDNASLDINNDQEEITVFESNAWKRERNVQYGYNLNVAGFYLPDDPGYLHARLASSSIGYNVWAEITLPSPDSTVYQTGEKFTGFWNVQGIPLTIEPAALIKGDITFMSQGEIIITSPVVV